jgi:hypothetical protein
VDSYSILLMCSVGVRTATLLLATWRVGTGKNRMVVVSCGDWLFSWHGDKYMADVGDRDLTV